MSLLNIKIVTPEKLIYQESDLDSVTIPTESGEITILPNHIPIVSKVNLGEILARKKDKEESIVTTKGFLKLDRQGQILVLADYAVRSEDVEVAKVEEAKIRAEGAMREKISEKEFVIAEAELKRTLLELKVAQKRKIKVKGV